MKILQKVFCLFIASLALASCDREYTAPPLGEPTYEGAPANITIVALKEKYAAATQDNPITITEELVLKARISGNDESGNIFKQIYIQDNTGGMPILVDQSSVYTTYRVGQEVFIHLNGMCISVYGGEQQIGHPGGYLFRTPWETFITHVFNSGWPDASLVVPTVVTDISTLNLDVAKVACTLVKLEEVYFVNGGKKPFAPADAYGTELLKDASGNSIEVRTSSYANFASNQLPVGVGSVMGILGRFNGSWQLTIRSEADLFAFSGEAPGEPEPPVGIEVFFNETFGTGDVAARPLVAAFTGYDMKAPITYSDASNLVSVRATKAITNHAWLPAGKNAYFTIGGINTSTYSKVTLSYEVAANLFDANDAMNLNALTVKCNGIQLAVPSIEVSKEKGDDGKFYTIRLENIAISDQVTIEFFASETLNTKGLRLDNIKLSSGESDGGGGPIVPDPVD